MPQVAAASHAESLSFLLSQVGAACAARFADGIAPLGLTPRAYGVLSLLGSQAPTQQQLADDLGIHRNVMVGVIDDLETKGFVERKRDVQDRRAFRIQIRPGGRKAIAEAQSAIASLDAEITAALSSAETSALGGSLLKLADSWRLGRGVHPSMTARE